MSPVNQEVQRGENLPLAVIIATKNRAEAIEKYAFASLAQSEFRDFLCVVWDASDDDSTQKVVEKQAWNFPVYYFRAPRMGSSSQRNDAAFYVLTEHPDVQFVLFMDDDSELSTSALGGVVKTFEKTDADIVNVTRHLEHSKSFKTWLRRKLGMNHNWSTNFFITYHAYDATPGINADWTAGSGVAFKVEIFRDDKIFFPEPFQQFGGYAAAEDFALSFFLKRKMGKCILNSLEGYHVHHTVSGKRLDFVNKLSARRYNYSLLFEALYHDTHGVKKAWLTVAFALRFGVKEVMLFLTKKFADKPEVLRGIRQAKEALAEFHRKSDIKKLFARGVGKGWED